MGGSPRLRSWIAGRCQVLYILLLQKKRLLAKPCRHPIDFWALQKGSLSLSSARRYAVTRHQLPPQYPGGSTERRVYLEGTRKDSTASGASPWTAAAHAAGTHRTHYLPSSRGDARAAERARTGGAKTAPRRDQRTSEQNRMRLAVDFRE
jgi:hypothetical protein